MPRYEKYGSKDDRTLQDLDSGFIGFNNRLRPDQLPAGILEKSENGRLDRNGEWNVRNGTDIKSSPVAVGVDALVLPFTLLADDNSVTVTINGDDDLQIANYNNISSLPATGSIKITGLTGVSPDPTASLQAYTKSGSNLIIAGTFSGTPAGTTIIKFPVLNDSAVNKVYGSCVFSDPNSNDNQSYILMATNTSIVAVQTSTFNTSNSSIQTYTLSYEAGVVISSEVEMIQAFNKVFIFRKGDVALEVDLSANNITSSPTVTKVANGEFSQPVRIESSVRDFSIVDQLASLQTTQSFNEGDQITFLDEGSTANCGLREGAPFTVNKVYTAAAAVGGGITGVLNLADQGAGNASGLALKINTASAHGLKKGQTISLASLGNSELNGNQSVSKVNSTTQFEVIVNASFTIDSDVTGTVTPTAGVSFMVTSANVTTPTFPLAIRASDPVFIKKASEGLGYIHMPTPEFGVLHQRRLIVPYQFDPEDSNNSRKIFDELIVSDILDSDTYDRIYASFRFNAGASDFTVGVVSFTEDSILVFNKNSIYRVSNTLNPTNATTQLLTNEIGCLARKTIAQVGKNVFFLSDDGVYSLEFLDEYNLRGTQTPLSEPIQSTIDRINQDAASKSVGVYFDNRYYLAVPLDGNDFNSHILVYNFLTRQWESEDKINSSANFHYTNLIVAGMGSKRGVYSTNIDGGIHLIAGDDDNFSNEALTGSDRTITNVGGTATADPILGVAKTRMYTFADIGRKKFNSFAIQAESSPQTQSNFSIRIQTENIDLDLTNSASLLGSASTFLGTTIRAGEDVAIRGRIGNKRAYGAQFQIENTLGRPKIKTIKTSATQTFRSTNPAI